VPPHGLGDAARAARCIAFPQEFASERHALPLGAPGWPGLDPEGLPQVGRPQAVTLVERWTFGPRRVPMVGTAAWPVFLLHFGFRLWQVLFCGSQGGLLDAKT